MKIILLYTSLALAWSLTGFSSPERLQFTSEYSPHFLVLEIGGHILFGLVVGLFTRSIGKTALSGLLAAAIDVDHMISIFFFPILDRAAHSIFFAILASLVLGWIAGERRRLSRDIFVLTASAIMSHLSYDTFVGNGNFPLLAPLSFKFYNFPDWFWLPLEIAAISLTAIIFRTRKVSS